MQLDPARRYRVALVAVNSQPLYDLMMTGETKGRAGLPETYWTLHRNSLLFSTALLVFSLPSVSINPHQTFLIFEVKDIAEPLVLAGLLIAATYSLIAFIVEWITEARGQGMEELELLRSAADEVREVVGLIKAQADSVEGRHQRSIEDVARIRDELTTALRQLKDRFEHLSPADQQFVDQFRNRARTELNFALVELLKELEAHPARFIEFYADPAIMLESIDPILDTMGKQILASMDLRTAKPDLWWMKSQLTENLKKLRAVTRSLPDIIKPLVEQTSRFRNLNRLLNLDRSVVTVRIWVIGIGFPVAIYGAAVVLLLAKALAGPLSGIAAGIGYAFGPPL